MSKTDKKAVLYLRHSFKGEVVLSIFHIENGKVDERLFKKYFR